MWVSGTSINPLTVWETNSAINQNVAIRFTYSLRPRALPAPLPQVHTAQQSASRPRLSLPWPTLPCECARSKARKTGHPQTARQSPSFSTHKGAQGPRTFALKSHCLPGLDHTGKCCSPNLTPHASVPLVVCLETSPSRCKERISARSARVTPLNCISC